MDWHKRRTARGTQQHVVFYHAWRAISKSSAAVAARNVALSAQALVDRTCAMFIGGM